MTTATLDKVKRLATDLRKGYPRSARTRLAGYIIAARALDKCRADIVGWQGEYHYNCPLSHIFLDFAGITADAFRDFVATGASDEAVEIWIGEHARHHTPTEIAKFNNEWLDKRLSELDDHLQTYMEEYWRENCPPDSRPYTWFDVYDIEEERIRA